ELSFPPYSPQTPARLRQLDPAAPGAIFEEIGRGDILLHHPYHSFASSVLRFIESAARDPDVLAIQLTIYRTSSDSPIVAALADAARRGKQVAVLVEITARFDEAPNIAWGAYLEKEGVHVAYGVEELKTHVKLALVVREEAGIVRRYLHVGTGNYHTGTARIYEDLGILTADPEICEDAAMVFAAITGATPLSGFKRMLVAPVTMRERFVELIRRETDHARHGRPAGIEAKMNQLQDVEIIRELYRAGRAGVPITLNVRGLCCLRPGVPGLSENIRVFGIIGRYLEHSRLYRFENGGDAEYFTGSADWMYRNLDRRVETVVPVKDPRICAELERTLALYRRDNASAWDCGPDGVYTRRRPAVGEERRAVQEQMADAATPDDDEPAPRHDEG
ncbi:MAG TPA: polyphosphate kinase 1, partial [Candidatus Polarisedimenticolaceae bacterium]|nr:polyphosphate kinase 1 [Candidatus Polarisedimenticolaceae bacterium]